MNNPITARLRIDSPLGAITLARTAQGLRGVWFAGQKYERDCTGAGERLDDPLLRAAQTQLDEYWAGQRKAFDFPLDPQGTTFQRRVWLALARIRCGITRSYREIAQSIGAPHAVRATGSAIGRNPLSVIVPCHRVVGSDGSLTGYAGGLERKIALLRLEGAR